MLNRIHSNHLPIKAETNMETLTKPEIGQAKARADRTTAKLAVTQARRPDPLGVEVMRARHGEDFTTHYYQAFDAAGRVEGREFLAQYRALKRCAKQQGMSPEEFRGFERCLYRSFYRAASRDSIQRIQDGRELRVKAHELAYIAKVGDISASQLERDAIAERRSQCVGRMKAISARYGVPYSRSTALA